MIIIISSSNIIIIIAIIIILFIILSISINYYMLSNILVKIMVANMLAPINNTVPKFIARVIE